MPNLEQIDTPKKFETVSVIGLGYIGLPTAAILASRKLKVVGVDVSQDVVETINQGKIHLVEPDLDILVHAVVSEDYLRATLKPEPADAFLIAVPTPFKDNHEPDLSYIKAAAQMIAPVLKRDDLVVLESTSPVGATEQLVAWLAEARPDLRFPCENTDTSDIKVAHCPERVLPGHVLRELVQNDRVIGGITNACSVRAEALYKVFVEGECVITDARTAEMCKLTENSFRDVNIAFANELSIICDKFDINVWELIQLANRHPRVNILKPGPGVGGHCIAVDPWFIVSSAPEEAQLITTARHVNDSKPLWVLDKIKSAVDLFLKDNPVSTIQDVTIACFGLCFKADIDDLRESPAREIVRQISEMHTGPVLVIEPHIKTLPEDLVSQVNLMNDSESALVEADIVLLLVDHKAFNTLPQSFCKRHHVIDTRGIWTSEKVCLET